jgi:hypothetical protein
MAVVVTRQAIFEILFSRDCFQIYFRRNRLFHLLLIHLPLTPCRLRARTDIRRREWS